MGGTGNTLIREIVYTRRPDGTRGGAYASQKRFHALKTRFKGFSGPVGSGKSAAFANEILIACIKNPGRTGYVCAPTYPMLQTITIPVLRQVLEDSQLPHTYLKGDKKLFLIDTRSEIVFRTMEDPERLRGPNLAWFGVDELTYCSKDSWLRLEARLRDPHAQHLQGFAAWTPKGFDWVYDKFIGPDKKPNYEAVIAKPYENTALPSDYYQSLIESYDEQFARQEVFGEYLAIGQGRAYHAFDRAENVKPCSYDPNLPILWSLDFNVNPMCSILAQIQPTSTSDVQLMVFDELFIMNCNTERACEEFLNRISKWTVKRDVFVNVYGDATGQNRKTTGGAGAMSDWAVVRNFFARNPQLKVSFKYKTSNPSQIDRVAEVNGMLCNYDRRRRLFVDPKCRKLIADLERVCWKEGARLLDQETDPMLTHISDALGYLCNVEFGLRRPSGFSREVIV